MPRSLSRKLTFQSGGSFGTIGVEGVDAVVLGGDVDDVVRALAGNFNGRDEERLGIDGAVDTKSAERAELFGVDVLRSEDLFVERGAGAEVVVLRGGDLSSGGDRGEGER